MSIIIIKFVCPVILSNTNNFQTNVLPLQDRMNLGVMPMKGWLQNWSLTTGCSLVLYPGHEIKKEIVLEKVDYC